MRRTRLLATVMLFTATPAAGAVGDPGPSSSAAPQAAAVRTANGSRPADPDTVPVAMFRGDAAHTATYDVQPVEHLGGIQWRFPTRGPVRSSPVVAGDVVYVGSGDGFLYAIDRQRGREIWRYDAGAAVTSSPAVYGDLVYAQDRQGELFALDRRTGALRWQIATGPDVPWDWGGESGDVWVSSPVVAAGVVVFGSGDGHVYAVDARTGRVRWRHRTGGRVRSTPAVAGGVVVVGSMDGSVYVLDLETGELIRRLDTEGRSLFSGDFGFDRKSIQSAPTIVDGRIYVGAKDGFLYAFSLDDGRLLWRNDHEVSWVLGGTAVRDGLVFNGTSDGHFVHAVDARTGEEVWRHETPTSVWSSPVVVGDFVYISGNSGTLYALDRRTGAERWRFFTGDRMISSPTPADGMLFVGSADGGVYALRAGDRPIRRTVFWDSTLVRATWNREHEALRDYFAERGYDVVDSPGLAGFLEARLRDGDASVVVFAMNRVPASIASEASETTLFRRYLDAGGKIVWTGIPPFMWRRDPETGSPGDLLAIDRDATRRLLGVDHGRAIFDSFGARPTDEGRRWGLSGWWRSAWPAGPDPSITPLATDENGRAAAWVRQYGGEPGTGFVRLRRGADPSVVYRAAEFRPRPAGAVNAGRRTGDAARGTSRR